jgi:protoporphyrinogen oxidase
VRVAVIGAGVCGLVAAHRIAAAGHEVDVYERWPGLGGQAATIDVGGGHLLERYYHHLFTTDRHIAALYDELGLELEWRTSSVAMFARGRQWPFTTPGDLLRFGPLPPFDRVRMGAAVVALQRFANDRAPYERVTARAWIEKWMGGAAYREVWGPMLRGKFGARADEIAMVWLWNKLRLRRGEDSREEKLGYPPGSWEPMFHALEHSIEGHGGRVLIDRPAIRIEPGFEVTYGATGSFRYGHDPRRFERAGSERYDRVLITVPNDVFAALTGLPEPPIEYFAALCLLLELDRPFSDFYWTNVADRDLPFVGLIEHTNFVEPEHYDGRRFLYVANYLEHGHELLSLDADAVLERYTPGLRKVNPAFDRAWIKNVWLHREPAAQPIVTVGYHERIPPLRTSVPGLFLANTTQVYPEDRGTNYAVRLGDEAAREVLA